MALSSPLPPIFSQRVSPDDVSCMPRIHPRVLVGLGTAAGLLMLIGGIVWAALAGQNLPDAWFPRDCWARDMLIGAGVGVVFTGLAARVFSSVPSLRRVERLIVTALDMHAMRPHHALIFGLLAGIPEEILFRGAMQPAWGLWLTAVTFGSLHAMSVAYFLYATLAGVMLGALALWRDGLWAPITAHTLIDVLMFLLLMRRWRQQQHRALSEDTPHAAKRIGRAHVQAGALPLRIDAHAHLDHYGDLLPAALEEIAHHRILTVSVSMDVDSYRQAQAIAGRSPYVLATFGIHPWKAPLFADNLPALDGLIAASPMLGEIGLDTYWVEDPAHYPAQWRVFEHFLAAARDQDKIVNLHTKGAEREVLDLLRSYQVRRAIVHWYSGPLDVLDELLAWGAYFTVGVEVLHSETIRTIARRIPPERLLTETDNPGGWDWLVGEPGMPGLVKDVTRALATLCGTDEASLAAQVCANLADLIGDDPRLSVLRRLLAN